MIPNAISHRSLPPSAVEGHYSEIAREMVVSGDYLTPWLAGDQRARSPRLKPNRTAKNEARDREIRERLIPGWVHGPMLIQLTRQQPRSGRVSTRDPVPFVSHQ